MKNAAQARRISVQEDRSFSDAHIEAKETASTMIGSG